jgi:hypothetical protein
MNFFFGVRAVSVCPSSFPSGLSQLSKRALPVGNCMWSRGHRSRAQSRRFCSPVAGKAWENTSRSSHYEICSLPGWREDRWPPGRQFCSPGVLWISHIPALGPTSAGVIAKDLPAITPPSPPPFPSAAAGVTPPIAPQSGGGRGVDREGPEPPTAASQVAPLFPSLRTTESARRRAEGFLRCPALCPCFSRSLRPESRFGTRCKSNTRNGRRTDM